MPPKRKRSESGKSFRFQAVTLYATYPQCPTTKERVRDNVLKEFGDKLEYWIVCSEKHEDGSDHIHLLIKFKSKIDRHTADFADCLSKDPSGKNYHGNYQSAKNVHDVIKYIKKDGNFIDSGNLPEQKVKLSTAIATAIREGKSLRDVDRLDPGYTLNNLKKIKEYFSLMEEFKEEDENKNLKKLQLPMVIPGLNPEVQPIVDWCNDNFYQRNRAIRTPQLWIKAPIRCGKTTWLQMLQKFMRCYIVGYERESFDEYSDEKYDLIVFDEYKAQKKLEFLNSLIDGQHKRLMQLYQGQKTTKKVNLPVLFLSNYHPLEAYSAAANVTRDAFIDRLCIVELIQSDLFQFIEFLQSLDVAPAEEEAVNHLPPNVNDLNSE